jgi:hypothetical protein
MTAQACSSDDGTRKELESMLNAADPNTVPDFVTIDDVYGVEFFVCLSRIVMIHNTSPETRLIYRQHNKAIEEEKKQLGPWEMED